MKLNLELIDRLFGKSGRSIQRMLESDQLTKDELLDFSLLLLAFIFLLHSLISWLLIFLCCTSFRRLNGMPNFSIKNIVIINY